MKKLDIDLEKLFKGIGNRSSQKFIEEDLDQFLGEKEVRRKPNISKTQVAAFIKRIWQMPEIRIVLLVIACRIFFILFTQWPMDFDFYIDIVQRVLAGERLYTDIISTHMPLADILYVAMYFICPWKNNIIALRLFMKFPFLIADIGIAIAVMKIVEKAIIKRDYEGNVLDDPTFEKVRKSKLTAGYFVAFALPLILQTGGGRYDSLLIFCFAMVIYCIQIGNWFGIAFYAALGSSVKYIGIIFLPFVIFWMKKDDILPFLLGLLLGFLPIFPFLITIPSDFISAILLRDSHIAYGFSLWHAIFIIWNGFKVKYVGGIADTYTSQDEPWFIQKLYMPLFVGIYFVVFVIYILRYRGLMKTHTIDKLPLSKIILLVYLPIFMFAICFKAINIQILAWFIPFIALRKKKGLLIEYSLLTLIHGIALVIYEAYNPEMFLKLSEFPASENTFLYRVIVLPALKLTQIIPAVVWVSIIFVTIIWYLTRTVFEFIKCSRELLRKESIPVIPI
ncbi:MAG: hypothetical protein KGD59_05405 [Candidatus Heimdallarchaeota archaeon]|nr:hypothetical protein [Candidatus Heimdallarchaeota archaeon]MBY8993967.1 hypothetical protein [Candidatus Heimdallarchaeota archaeon]